MGILDQAKAFLFRRRNNYIETFSGNCGEEVLRDLAHFCRAHKNTFNTDARTHALLEGRREVWLRIQQHLNLTPDQLWELFDGRK